MKMKISGSQVRLEMDPEEALMMLARMAETTNKASRLGSWTFSECMPVRDETLNQDFHGGIDICITKEQVGR